MSVKTIKMPRCPIGSAYRVQRFAAVVFSVSAMSFFACSNPSGSVNSVSDQITAPLVLPAVYSSANFAANTATQSGVRTRMSALTGAMVQGRTSTTVIPADSLLSLYTAAASSSLSGSPSLSSLAVPEYDAKVKLYLDELSKASGNSFTLAGAPAGNGGKFGAYLFDENGLELEQMVEKGLFLAAMYHHALTLLSGTVTEATIDQLVSIYGATPGFANTDDNSNSNRDRFSAQYAARRDKNDGAGLYSRIKTNLLTAQAAVRKGSRYNEARDQALRDFKLNWEKAIAATIINYCHSTISGLTSAADDNARAVAMHAYGEACGFASGLRSLPESQKKITNAQLDEILTLLLVPYTGTPTSYRFLTTPSLLASLDAQTGVIKKLQDIYGFSNTEIEEFKQNWITVQARK